MFLVYIFIAILFSFAAQAQDTPVPSLHPLKAIEQEKEQARAKKKDLEKQAKNIESDLGKTQKTLVETTKKLKQSETELTTLEKKIEKNKAEQKSIEARLKTDRASIGDLILALERLDRTPPEAILARPGAPLETAQSAMLLQGILPNIYKRAENLRKDLARLDDIIREQEEDQAKAKLAAEQLDEKQKEVAKLASSRKELYAKTRGDLKVQEESLRQISNRAENLRDLVGKLKTYEEEERQKQITQNDVMAQEKEEKVIKNKRRPTPMPAVGAAQLPISGSITVGYKQMDDIGAQSQGLSIEGRSEAVVVSPMGGVIQFAGEFKNYGRIIIVEHQKDYHSLIAGLARIDTVVGQSVAAGEPLGVLAKSSSDGGAPTLYYELRQNGEPVNPARKFSGL